MDLESENKRWWW